MTISDLRPPEEPVRAQSQEFFRTDHLKADLARRSARGGLVTVTAQALKLTLQLCSTAVLARLLTPADFGVFAMVAVFTGFIGRFRDLGLSAATVQRAEIDHGHASTLFWVNVAGGVALMALTLAIAPMLSLFFGVEALAGLTMALAITFVFAGLSAQHIALMRRQMRFRALACIDVGAMACGIAAGIITAVMGGRYWSLVALAVAQSVAEVVLCYVLSGWRPGRWQMSAQVGEMLRFGGTLTAGNMVNFVSRNFDNLVIGRFSGAEQLGFYSKAYALLLVPVQQINGPIAAVAIPAMARLQDQVSAYRRYYLKVVQVIAYLSMPLAVLLAVLSEEAVLILLGPQWRDAANIFQILSLFVIVQNVAVTTGWVLQSLGRATRLLQWQAAHAVIYVIACLIGVRWGAMGVAVVTTAQGLLAMLPAMWFAYHGSPIRMGDVLMVMVRPALVAAFFFAVAWGVHSQVLAQPLFLRVGAVLGAAALAGGIVLLAAGPVRRDLKSFVAAFRGAKA